MRWRPREREREGGRESKGERAREEVDRWRERAREGERGRYGPGERTIERQSVSFSDNAVIIRQCYYGFDFEICIACGSACNICVYGNRTSIYYISLLQNMSFFTPSFFF